MTAQSKEAPVPGACEPEWLARPIADLIRYLSCHYYEPISRRLTVSGDTADELRRLATDVLSRSQKGTSAFGVRLSSLVSTLRLVMEAHAWSERDVLFPAAVAVETRSFSSSQLRQDSLNILMEGIRQEHELIRELLASLARTIEEHAGADPADDLEAFVSDVEIVSFMIAEQLDLEDRCLWPRVHSLFGL
jgi:iron-sulfur cluster repair protein YtfE (RIC family)